MSATPEQVAAAERVLGRCDPYVNRQNRTVCIDEEHERFGEWSDRGCPLAVAIADAVAEVKP